MTQDIALAVALLMGTAQSNSIRMPLEYQSSVDIYGHEMFLGESKQKVMFFLNQNSAMCSVATVNNCDRCLDTEFYYSPDKSESHTITGPAATDRYVINYSKAINGGDYATDKICVGDKCSGNDFKFLELTSIDKNADNFFYWGGACGISPP